jgi:hypothetical protein
VPSFLVEQDGRQPVDARLERGLAVLVQKNRASRNRAVSTRSELRAMTSGFSACVLVTARNAGFSFPSSSTTGK